MIQIDVSLQTTTVCEDESHEIRKITKTSHSIPRVKKDGNLQWSDTKPQEEVVLDFPLVVKRKRKTKPSEILT